MPHQKKAPVFRDVQELKTYIGNVGSNRVVLSNGCFDPLHVGHVRYLTDARQHGDFLVVALNDDASTRMVKGKGRPVIGEDDRAEVLASLAAVDAVLLFSQKNVAAVLETLRPNFHAKGTDYTVDTVPELETSKRLGIETIITGDPKSHASSEVLKKMKDTRKGNGEAG
jgi:rfaE bifunctional protein nucleotidyltransferase chain/domain